MARGEGRLFEGGNCFRYFGRRGAIIRERRLIEGRLLLEEIRYIARKLELKTVVLVLNLVLVLNS